MSCEWVFKIASRSSETAKRLKELCEQGLTLQHVAMMTPMELMELLDVDAITTAENLIRRAREAAGFEFVRRYQPSASAPVLKTGIAEFDEKTPWGGLKFGAIYGFAGEYGTGKSILAMQAAAGAACAGRHVAYIDTENAYNHGMMERLLKRFCGGEWEKAVERVEVFQVPDVYGLIVLARERLGTHYTVIAVDSIIEPFRAQFRGRETLQVRQQTLHYVIDLLRRRAFHQGALVILTNQVLDVPEAFAAGVKRPAGGNILLHTVNFLFMMVRPSKQKPEGYMWPLDVPGMSPEVRIRYTIEDDGLH